MNDELATQIEGCRAAQARLSATLESVTDDVTRRPSRLPNWTVGHTLTHIARNADSVLRRIEGALRDEVVDQYLGGVAGRAADIEAGASRSAAELVADVRATNDALDRAWHSVPDDAWPRLTRAVSGKLRPLSELPFSRWREVEVHHADLGLDFSYRDWSDGYLAQELPRQLEGMDRRLRDPGSRRRMLAWLIGREAESGPIELDPWG